MSVIHLIINRRFFLSFSSFFFIIISLGNLTFFWETFCFKNCVKISSNVSMQNRSGSKIETKSTMMALHATLVEKAARGENEDNDDW